MYSHCIFCHRSLGTNQVLEEHPVGRRIAFDAARGRLWVICRGCARWNLSPLETRWEAVEACERAFRGTRVRVSTANIGMARLADGSELVRIGAPAMPEFAAWRYTARIVRRRRRALALGALGAATLPASYGLAWAVGMVPMGAALWMLSERLRKLPGRRVLVRLPTPAGTNLVLRREQTTNFAWVPAETGEPWRLDVSAVDTQKLLKISAEAEQQQYLDSLPPDLQLTGHDALHAARVVLAKINRSAGSARQVDEALRVIDRVGDPFSPPERWLGVRGRDPISLFFAWQERRSGIHWDDFRPVLLEKLPVPVRLAMEIAANEEAERRAMEGELHLLEAAWREAEEVARIADGL